MIPLAIPNLSGNEGKYLEECVTTNFVSSVGKFVEKFELSVASAMGAKRAVAVSSGTAALHIALVAVGVKRDDLVILPDFTFIASANAISHAGAKPWLFDVDYESWTLNPEKLEEELHVNVVLEDGQAVHRRTRQKIGAIMPVYTLGHPADMDAINEIAARYEIPVVADSAAAIGAHYRGSELGGLAAVSCLSFNGNKTITCGGGGAVVCNSAELADRIKHLSTTARVGKEYDHDEIGYNYRLTNIEAAVGLAQIEQLNEFVAAKRRIAERYRERLAPLAGTKLFPEAEWAESAFWFSGIIVAEDKKKPVRVCEELGARGIQASTFWKPVHKQRPYASMLRADDLSVSNYLGSSIVTLPSSTGLIQSDQDKVIDEVIKILDN